MTKYMRRLFVNFGLFTLLLIGFVLMYAVKTTELVYHEIAGLVMAVLVTVHVVLLRSFFSFVLKQRAPMFIFRDVMLLGIFLCLLGTLVSGISISNVVFSGMFRNVDRMLMLEMHNGFTAYLLLFIGAHLGCYIGKFCTWLNDAFSLNSTKRFIVRIPGYIFQLGLLIVALNGLRLVGDEDFVARILFEQGFSYYDYDRSVVLFLVDQVSIIGLGMFVSHVLYQNLMVLSFKKEKPQKKSKK